MGSNEKMTIQNVPGAQARPVMEDQNHTKTSQCGQCIKACACPDHQLHMEMIIKDIIVKGNSFLQAMS